MRIRLLFLALAALLMATSCTDTDYASKVAGSYTCTATAYVGAEQAKITSHNETVIISRVDDNTVNVALKSRKWGTAEFNGVEVTDYNYSANLAGEGTIKLPDQYYTNNAVLSGTITYKTHAIALSVNVKDYNTRLIISFTN